MAPTSPNPAYRCLKQDRNGASGLAALATVTEHYGLPVSVPALREIAQLGDSAVNAVLLLFAAGKCGFDMTPLEGEFGHLTEVAWPAIVTFGDEQFHVLFEVGADFAIVGRTDTGEVRRLTKEEFEALWTGDVFALQPNASLEEAREQLRRCADPRLRLARWAGVSPISSPRLACVAALAAWLAAAVVTGPVTLLTGACLLVSLWLAAFPRGCRQCEGTAGLAGGLPLPWLGFISYAILTALSWFGWTEAVRIGLLAASGGHVALVGILVRKRIACYPCLAIAVLAWAALGLSWAGAGAQIWILPATAVATFAAIELAAKFAVGQEKALMHRLEQQIFAEPVRSGQARLVVYTRRDCPLCVFFKSAIRPALEEAFGDALAYEDRDAGTLPLSVPVFLISGGVPATLTAIPTEEMFPRLSDAIEAALTPAFSPHLGALAERGAANKGV